MYMRERIDRVRAMTRRLTRLLNSSRRMVHVPVTHRNLQLVKCNLRLGREEFLISQTSPHTLSYLSTFHHNGHRRTLKQSRPNVDRQRQWIRVRIATTGQVSRRSSRGKISHSKSNQKRSLKKKKTFSFFFLIFFFWFLFSLPYRTCNYRQHFVYLVLSSSLVRLNSPMTATFRTYRT